ncbi:MAG: hypothetical protein NZ898_08440 [Myxococcota bacterium]|nr:hypothetical protein [Myxococcota bacterium]MDW8362265.1 hypothetical protein [Myxococcales bacterium]
MAELSPYLVDKRVVERNLRRGLLDPKELERWLRELPDRSDNVATIVVDAAAGPGGSERRSEDDRG